MEVSIVEFAVIALIVLICVMVGYALGMTKKDEVKREAKFTEDSHHERRP